MRIRTFKQFLRRFKEELLLRGRLPEFWQWAIFAFLVFRSIQSLERCNTDSVSEEQSVTDAVAIVEGKAKYWLYSYTHCPNGLGYLILPLVALGVRSYTALRSVPLVLGWLALAALILASRKFVKMRAMGWFFCAGILATFLQPGVLDWMGALNEASVAFVFAILPVTLLFRLPCR